MKPDKPDRRSDGRWLGGLCCAAVALNMICLALALTAGSRFGVAPSTFYRDPAIIAGHNFATGSLSSLGAVGWFVGATTTFFAASLVRNRNRSRFLLLLGTLTAVLGIDDLFLVHDGLLPFL
ncbi:hypothetical protein [Microvirga roseola]|uniref:hypothetical protein n=1 Tax=Microvirga roseola TaxID=2883126 RepID=UPI001E5808BF|nr:hypothetical protein [Microvirga roseola]